MSDKRYTHYIRVPVTGYVLTQVRSDDPSPDRSALFKLYLDQAKGREKVEMLTDHERIVEGNLCNAVLNEITLDYSEDEQA